MEQTFDFGMIGIGVMGSNLLLNMADHGFAVIGYDLKQERADALEAAAAEGTMVKGTTDLPTLVQSLKKPRKLMMLVPAGAPVDAVINNIQPLLEPGDILIDGGNSFFEDTIRRQNSLQSKGIHFFGMGVSGGEAGARYGPSMMPGGDKEAWQYLQPVLEAIAAKAGDTPCVAYMGNGAAGHYVKMVHNGIEYAMMQLISEAYGLLKAAGYTNPELHTVFLRWNDSILRSFLIEITADIFKTEDHLQTGQYLVDAILDQAGAKGTGKWTSQEAMNLGVPVPTIDTAVAMRDLSAARNWRIKAAGQWKHETKKDLVKGQPLEDQLLSALTTGFLAAYAQGLSLIARGASAHQMDIPLPDVIRVWRSGCIIRSELLSHFQEAFSRQADLPNVLLDTSILALLQEHMQAAREAAIKAMQQGYAMPALFSVIGYIDALRDAHLPMNLVQAQRDYFGAHTYRRTDREGVFHTEWNQ